MFIIKLHYIFKKIKSIFLYLLVVCFMSSSIAFGQTQSYIVKAAFVERFTHFIEWPQDSTKTNQEFTIGIIGKNQLNSNIEQLYTEQKVKIKDKKISFKYFKSHTDLQTTHILLVSPKTDQDLVNILNFTKNKPILTISDCKTCIEKGVHINFFITNGSIRFSINNSTVKQSNLSISYLLLQAAGTVINE